MPDDLAGLTEVERRAAFGGTQLVYEHESQALGCRMRVAVFLPPGIAPGDDCDAPALFFLSGLTCTLGCDRFRLKLTTVRQGRTLGCDRFRLSCCHSKW